MHVNNPVSVFISRAGAWISSAAFISASSRFSAVARIEDPPNHSDITLNLTAASEKALVYLLYSCGPSTSHSSMESG